MIMKNKLLTFVFVLIVSNVLNAQISNIRNTRFNTEEQLFGNPTLYSTPVNFTFVNNQNKAVKVSFEMYTIHQLNQLPNLDSILNQAKQYLSYFVDSFKNGGSLSLLLALICSWLWSLSWWLTVWSRRHRETCTALR